MQARRWPAWLIAFTLVFSLFLSIGGATVSADDGEGNDQSVNTGEVNTGDEGNTGGDEGNTGGDEGNTGGDEGNTGGDEGNTGGDEGSGGIGALASDEEVNAAADANVNIFSNVDGAVFQVRYWTPPSCGNIHDGPETTAGGSATFTIDTAGTYCFELVSPPPGYQLSGNSVGHFANGYIVKSYSEIQNGWSVTFEPIPTRQLTLRTHDVTSGSEVPFGGSVFNILSASGGAIDPNVFPGLTGVTIPSGGSVVLTVPAAGVQIQLVSTPTHFALAGDSIFHFQNNNTTSATTASDWTVLLQQVTRSFTLRSHDVTSGSEVPFDGAVYNILDAAGAPLAGLSGVTTSGGSATFTVPYAPIRLQLVTPPANYELAGDSIFHFQNNNTTDPIGTGTNDWTVLFRHLVGDLEVSKWYCKVADEDDVSVDWAYPTGDKCGPGPASFDIYLNGSYVGTYSTDAYGNLLVEDLLVSNAYTITETGSQVGHPFSITAGQTTYLDVTNYVYISGQLHVTKYFCPAKKASTDISVDYPVSPNSEQGRPDPSKKCWLGNAEFEVYLYGEGDPIEFHTGKDGSAWLTLPITNSTLGQHVLVEVETGEYVYFDIYEDETTEATVVNYYKKDKPHKPGKPSKPGSADGTTDVDTLPNTGTGSTDNSNALFFATGSMILFGLGAATMRRRWLQ